MLLSSFNRSSRHNKRTLSSYNYEGAADTTTGAWAPISRSSRHNNSSLSSHKLKQQQAQQHELELLWAWNSSRRNRSLSSFKQQQQEQQKEHDLLEAAADTTARYKLKHQQAQQGPELLEAAACTTTAAKIHGWKGGKHMVWGMRAFLSDRRGRAYQQGAQAICYNMLLKWQTSICNWC